MIRVAIVVAAVLGSLLPTVRVLGDESSARRVLEEAGLRKMGSYYVLPVETEVADKIEALDDLKKNLDDAVKAQKVYERQVAEQERQLRAAIEERRQVSTALSRTDHDKTVKNLAARLLELSDRIDLLTEAVNRANETKLGDSAVVKATDAYTQGILDLRQLVSTAQRDYERLNSDEGVKAALEDLRVASGRTTTLGPRKVFTRNVEKLDKLEAGVVTGEIELHSDGGVFWVDTVINGNVSARMVLDTGASFVSIPPSLAAQIGLKPTDLDQVLRMQTADGRTHEAHRMKLDSLRIGLFSAENVDCIVLPEEMFDAPPLLGGTFLSHFAYKINHASGLLTMAQVKSVEDEPKRNR